MANRNGANRNEAARPPKLLHPIFGGPAAALLIAALFTDYMYYSTALMQWANFSAWLIVGGLVVALVAAIFLVIDLLLGRAGPISWLEFVVLVGRGGAVDLQCVRPQPRRLDVGRPAPESRCRRSSRSSSLRELSRLERHRRSGTAAGRPAMIRRLRAMLRLASSRPSPPAATKAAIR